MLRQLFWVYGGFIVFSILSFGVLTLLHAPAMAAATPMARSLSTVIFIFWTMRLAVQWFVFDARPFLTTPFYRVGYHLLTVAFITLAAIYGTAAIGLGTRL